MTPYEIAKGELGVKELPGWHHNARILEYHSYTTLEATEDEVSWCSSFVSWCLEKASIRSTRSARARSYLAWGEECEPYEGCIAVFKRGTNPYYGHVAFFVKEVGNYILVLGGNQSDSVCFQHYKKENLLSYRKPKI
jgi:uncharacterized protein (TIGR02594 family)